MDDFYDQLKMSSNDNIKLILTPISEYQDSDDSSTEAEDFYEVDFKKNADETNKRRIDSMDEMGSDIDDENGQRFISFLIMQIYDKYFCDNFIIYKFLNILFFNMNNI